MSVPKKSSLEDLWEDETEMPVAVNPFEEEIWPELPIPTVEEYFAPKVEPMNVPVPVEQSGQFVNHSLNRIMEVFQEQAVLSETAGPEDIGRLELGEAKAVALLNAINGGLAVDHFKTIAEGSHLKFTRIDEMAVMNPILKALGKASRTTERKVGYVAGEMEETMDSLEYLKSQGRGLQNINPMDLIPNRRKRGGEFEDEDGGGDLVVDPESPASLFMHLNGLQSLFTASLDNLGQITDNVNKVIQLERQSGSRPYGNTRGGIPQVTQVKPTRARIEGGSRSGDGNGAGASGYGVLSGAAGVSGGQFSNGQGVVRAMTQEELQDILNRQRGDED